MDTNMQFAGRGVMYKAAWPTGALHQSMSEQTWQAERAVKGCHIISCVQRHVLLVQTHLTHAWQKDATIQACSPWPQSVVSPLGNALRTNQCDVPLLLGGLPGWLPGELLG